MISDMGDVFELNYTNLDPTVTLMTLSKCNLHHSSTLLASVALNNACRIDGLSQEL